MATTVVLDGNCLLELVQDGGAVLDMPLDGEFGTVTRVRAADYYTGETTVTPSASEQRLATTGLLVPRDIIINPIPSNYGLITWNGSTLTVS